MIQIYYREDETNKVINMNTKWNFPESATIHRTGLGEAGIETFTGSPIHSLVREICQNSLDVVKNDTDPVKMKFQYFEIPSESFPDKETLMDTFTLSV